MLLGLSAVAAALIFAIVKFFTTLHMRRLRDRHMRLVGDVKRERSRCKSLEGKLQVETSRRGAVEQKLGKTKRFKDDLFSRLRVELPESMQAELRACVDRNPIPEPSGVRVAHQLGLTDKISEALGHLCVLVVQTPATGCDDVVDALTGALESSSVRFSGPAQEEDSLYVTTAFDRPDLALDLLRATLADRSPETLEGVRAILMAGLIDGEFDKRGINHLFARSLHGARVVLESAPEGGLLVDGRAYEHLDRPDGLQLHSRAENLWHADWADLSVEPAETSASPDGESSASESASESTDATDSGAPAETARDDDAESTSQKEEPTS